MERRTCPSWQLWFYTRDQWWNKENHVCKCFSHFRRCYYCRGMSLVTSDKHTLTSAVTEICEKSGVCFLWSHLRHVRLGLSKCWCFFPATSCPVCSQLPFTNFSTNEASFILIWLLYRVGSPFCFLQQSFLGVANCCISYRAPQPRLPVGPASCSCHTSVFQQNNVKCGEGEKEEVQSSSQQRAEYTFQVSDS